MKRFLVSVTHKISAMVEVEAESLNEACRYVGVHFDTDDLWKQHDTPIEGAYYIDDANSFELD